MRPHVPLCLSILIVYFLSCRGQTVAQHAVGYSDGNNQMHTLGDTVAEPGKSSLIIYQATNGDYWFGSDGDGLYRYDGAHTIHYPKNKALPDGRIRQICEDQSGNLFFSAQDGSISRYDGRQFALLHPTKFQTPGKGWMLKPNDLWFMGGTKNNGPYRYDGYTLYDLDFPKHYMEDDFAAGALSAAWTPYDVYYSYRDSKGTAWFGTSNFGICRFDGRSLSWLYEEHLTSIAGGGSFGIRSIIEDKEGKFWFCNTKYRYDIARDPVSKADRNSNENNLIVYKREQGIDGIRGANGSDFIYFMSATKDANGDLWFATYQEGVWHYDGRKATHYAVKDVKLYSIYMDRRQQLWLGTHDGGPYLFNGKTFERFRP